MSVPGLSERLNRVRNITTISESILCSQAHFPKMKKEVCKLQNRICFTNPYPVPAHGTGNDLEVGESQGDKFGNIFFNVARLFISETGLYMWMISPEGRE